MGFPLVRRDTPPQSSDLPVLKRKRPAPTAASERAVSTRQLEVGQAEYDEILSLMDTMGRAIERSPQTYVSWQEEDFRNLFLVVLNALYAGGASGETFSKRGHLDIQVQDAGHVLFVAECKIWSGRADLLRAVGQLFGYCTWRDTKTALIVFDRNKDHTAVLRKIEDTLGEHESCLGRLPYDDEIGTRWSMRHPEDAERKLVLTSLAFPIPGIAAPR